LEFGIDLRKEMDELNLPITRPKITPPPILIKQSLDNIGLHPLLSEDVIKLFAEGHMNEALRKSGEILEATVIRWLGQQKFGRDLMAVVFNKNNPLIDIAKYHGSEILNMMDEREGFMFIVMGAMQWCKNIVSHGDVDQLPPHEAASRIILVNHILGVIDKTINKKSDEN
jgi:hypothetical protein